MVVRTLYSMENEPDVTGACPFADVASGSYCEDAVTWAAANGIVSGYSRARPACCGAAPLLRSVRLSGQRRLSFPARGRIQMDAPLGNDQKRKRI